MQSAAIFSSSSRLCVAPVGLHGKFIIRTFEAPVIFFSSSAAVSRKLSRANVGTETGMPWERVMLGP